MIDDRQTRFVVLEGLDGAGTTTQARRLAAALEARDLRVRLTAEPTQGPVGRICRAHVQHRLTLSPHVAALAFSADRREHLERVVRPALREGSWVVSDRYLLSTLAYQGAEGVDREWILAVSAGFDVPALTVFLDTPAPERTARMTLREAVERYEAPTLQAGLRASYLTSIDLLRDRGHTVVVLAGDEGAEALGARILAEVDRAC